MNTIKLLLIFTLLSFMLFSCNVDVENVELRGYVYDSKEKKPIKDAALKIENYFYGNSPDQSYAGFEVHYLRTDKSGFYSIKLDTSALINVKVFKSGYSVGFKSEEIPDKNEKMDFYLNEKTNNN